MPQSWSDETGNRFRFARMRLFLDTMDLGSDNNRAVRILDLGGSRKYWDAFGDMIPAKVEEIAILNLGIEEGREGRYSFVSGDATDLSGYADGSFDIVHSNSVIEHVGHWREMQAMADEIARVGQRYFVQTPNFWFPIEPHYRRPFFHYMSEDWRARRLQAGKVGYMEQEADYHAARESVQGCNLLTVSEMRRLFPDASIRRERLLGLTKSIMAIRAQT